MKYVSLLIFILLLSCSASRQRIIDTNEVPSQHRLSAYHFAKSQFEACKTGSYPKLTPQNATAQLIKNLTESEIKKACEKINKDSGELLELNLYQIQSNTKYHIYRYKAKYSATTRTPEIRVYATMDQKFDGIIYKPNWIEEYMPFTP